MDQWQMKPSLTWGFDVLYSVTPSSSGTTAGASLDSASSGFLPAINLTETYSKGSDPIVGDIKGPQKQQYCSERYVSCTEKAAPPPLPPPPPPPLPPPAAAATAVTIVPYTKRTFAQEKNIDLIDQSWWLSKGPAVASVINDPNLKIKQNRAAVMHHPVLRCQIDGCREDLSKAKKDYHRRHKVCEMHSKAPRVIKSGLEQRFCQQCSRFHVVVEFDDAKRSCRRRLEGHNKRRRKANSQASFSVASMFQLGHENLHVNHHHQLAMPMANMQFYHNNDGILRRGALGWPAGEQQKLLEGQLAMATTLPANFDEINSRLRAILHDDNQVNKASSSSSSSLLDFLLLQQHEQQKAFSCMGKGLSLCASTKGPACALSLLSSEPVITLDHKLPNHHYLTNHSLPFAGLSSDPLIHPQPALQPQPKNLALSMGMSTASSVIKEPLAAPNPYNYVDNMALIQSLAPHNPILARLMHEAASQHYHQQLDTAMELNPQHVQTLQGFANNV